MREANVGTINDMTVRIGAEADLAPAITQAEQQAQQLADFMRRAEDQLTTAQAQASTIREAQLAASAARTQRQIEAAFRPTTAAAGATPAFGIAATRELGTWDALQQEAAHHVGEHSLAVGRLEYALEGFSSEALGVNHVAGLLATSLGKFALGSVETVGILAGVAAIIGVYNYLTEAASKATKEQEKTIEAFEKSQHAAALGPQGENIEALNARIEALNKQADAEERIIQNARAAATGQHAGTTVNPFASNPLGEEIGAALAQRAIAEAKKLLGQRNEDLREAEAIRQGILDKASAETDSKYASNLAALLKYNEADKAARSNALILLKAWQDELAKLPQSDVSARAGLVGDINTLHNALFPKSETHDAEREQAAHISGLITMMENLEARGRSYSGVLTQLLDQYAALGEDIKRADETWEHFQTRSSQIHSILTAIRGVVSEIHVPEFKLPEITIPTTTTATAGGPLAALQRQLAAQIAATRFAQDQLAITNMERANAGQAPLSGGDMIAAHQKDVLATAEQIRKVINSTGLPPELTTELLDKLIKQLRDAGIEAKNLKSSLADVVSNISAAGGLAGALGAGDLATTLNNVAGAVSSIGAAAAQGFQNPAADINAATSVVTLVRGLFDSPLHREQLQVMRENNQRLTELSIRLAGFQSNASNTVQAGQAARSAIAGGAGPQLNVLEMLGTLQNQIDILTPYLNQVGLTWVQFAQIAKDAGFNLFDQQGRIVSGAFQQFANAANEAAKAAFTFTTSFGDQQSLINLKDALAGKITDADKMAAMLEAIQQTAPALLPGNYNTGTIQGRDDLRAALQQLIDGIQAGTIDPSKFGGFQNLQELLGAISPLVDAMNQLTSATVATTTALVNVPPTFKYAEFAFDAAQGDKLGGGLDSGIVRPPVQGGLPTSPVESAAASGAPLINVEALTISADPNAAPLEEQANEFLTILSQRALAVFGDATRWSELMPTI